MPLNLIFIQPGNYTIDDNGVPGDNISVIRDGNGTVIFTFGHPADGLGFTVSTPGVNLAVNFTDSMNAANFTVGSTDPDPMVGPPQSPVSIVMENIVTSGTVTLVANTTITEGGADAASDITAGALIMSAVSGIGTAGNAIETRTGLFEAETPTGGINIRNIGSVQIGGISADMDGIDVATSGNINFFTIGSIFLTEANTVTAAEVIHAGGTSGNVTLTASGKNSDIIGNVDNGAVTVPRGSATLTAGRDIQLGTIGADFNNDIITNNTLTLNAGRDILIDGFADILSDNFGLDTGGDLIFNAGRNIGILNLAGTSASVTASGSGGGNALITTGAGGALTVNGPGSFGLGSSSGDVIVNADRLLIDGGSGISAPSGQVTIRPVTEGREMILGSAGDASLAVELSDLELNRIFTPSLTLGSTETGRVSVIAPIAPISVGNAQDITIQSGSDIFVNANVTTIDDLTLRAGDDIMLVAGSVVTVGGVFTGFVDFGNTDAGFGGRAFVDAGFATAVQFFGDADADTLSGGASHDSLTGGGGADVLNGRAGNDTLDGGGGGDAMTGGLGNDTYVVDHAGDTVTEGVGEGADEVHSFVHYTLLADLENLTLLGTADINGVGNTVANTITGNAGENSLLGKDDNDSLMGSGGNDSLVGGDGDDLLNGGSGNDSLVGGDGQDQLNGGTSNDTLDGGASGDAMTGGPGDDTYVVNHAGDTVTEAAGEGVDEVRSSLHYTLLAEFENLTLLGVADINGVGNAVANTIIGNAGANSLVGEGGDDPMNGGAGDDWISGGSGEDQLNGSTGDDTLTGGNGADNYRFTNALDAATNVDRIQDFSGNDQIQLDDAIFSNIGAVLNAFELRIGAAAADADDRIIYNSATGGMFYDADGAGGAAQIRFATLDPGLALSNTDFLMV